VLVACTKEEKEEGAADKEGTLDMDKMSTLAA